MNLNLSRPLIFFDLETTGLSFLRDRIVEMSILKVYIDNTTKFKTFRFKPVDENGNVIHIPQSASDVHGIYDEDVVNEKTFAERADMIAQTFKGCDVAGYNSNNFDVPFLQQEFDRTPINFNLNDGSVKFIDVQAIFYKHEPRTLSAAYRFYCGKQLVDAHSATADTMATYEVLKAQLDKYDDISNDVKSLSEYSSYSKTMDLSGKIAYDSNENPIITFGKYKDRKVLDVFRRDPSYFNWIMQGDFSNDTKRCFEKLYIQSKSNGNIIIS